MRFGQGTYLGSYLQPLNLIECHHSAEKAVNERLAHTPELYLLALSQFAITADTEVVRPYSKHGKISVRKLK